MRRTFAFLFFVVLFTPCLVGCGKGENSVVTGNDMDKIIAEGEAQEAAANEAAAKEGEGEPG